MTVKHKCSGRTATHGGWGSYPCSRNATRECDGKWYCWQHDPERVEADKKKRNAKWQAKIDREAAKYTHIARNARLGKLVTPELVALLERLANMAVRIASETEAQYGVDDQLAMKQSRWVEEGHALAARIREALALEAKNV